MGNGNSKPQNTLVTAAVVTACAIGVGAAVYGGVALKGARDSAAAATHIKLVIESWAAVKGAFDLQTVGNLFYDTLFEMYPEMPATLFKGVDKEGQAKKLMESIDAVLIMLDGRRAELVSLLVNLGRGHCGYGAEKTHYVMVGAALQEVLRRCLREQFDADVAAAWAWAYNFIQTEMLRGAATTEGCRLLVEFKQRRGI